jgi:hypothetical protein
MPFRSKAQQRWMFAKHPEMAKRWAKETPSTSSLPEKVAMLSPASVGAFWKDLEKISASGTASEEVDRLYARSRETRKKAMPVLLREQKRLRALGLKNILPVSSTFSGLNLPDEGASDIDFNVGVRDVEKASKELAEKGIPFAETFQNQRIHQYRTPEGFDVEVKLRPAHEIAYQRAGWKRMVRMSVADKKAIVAEKHRLKESGDKDAYKAYKYSIYEKYGVIPPGGDWSKVKKAEYAPGLPSKKQVSPIPKVEKPSRWHMTVQHHPAVRAGNHLDLRVIDPHTGIAHSWATKKDLPKPGERIRVYQQPDHTEDYARNFRGHILGGYGRTKPKSKGVQKVLDEQLEVLQADDRILRFNMYRGKVPEEFVLARSGPKGRGAMWTLLNVTKTREGLKDLPFSKPKYKEIKPGAVDFSDPVQIMAAKLSGGHNTFLLESGKRPRIFSYREPKERKTGVIEHSHKLEDLYHSRVPKAVDGKGTILRGEVYARKPAGGPQDEEIVGGMMNANVWKSRELQKEHGKLRPAIFDVVKFKGEDYSGAGYEKKLKALRAVREHMPQFEIPDLAFNEKEKRVLFKSIKEKKHPATHEGVVLWHAHEPSPPIKVKFKGEHDVYVRAVEQDKDKEGKPKEMASAFWFSSAPDGPILGKITAGNMSHAERERFWKERKAYEGAVAVVEAPGEPTRKGALKKAQFKRWHPDKNDPEFWEHVPMKKIAAEPKQLLELKPDPWELGIHAKHGGKPEHRGIAYTSGLAAALGAGAVGGASAGALLGGPPLARLLTQKGREVTVREATEDVARVAGSSASAKLRFDAGFIKGLQEKGIPQAENLLKTFRKEGPSALGKRVEADVLSHAVQRGIQEAGPSLSDLKGPLRRRAAGAGKAALTGAAFLAGAKGLSNIGRYEAARHLATGKEKQSHVLSPASVNSYWDELRKIAQHVLPSGNVIMPEALMGIEQSGLEEWQLAARERLERARQRAAGQRTPALMMAENQYRAQTELAGLLQDRARKKAQQQAIDRMIAQAEAGQSAAPPHPGEAVTGVRGLRGVPTTVTGIRSLPTQPTFPLLTRPALPSPAVHPPAHIPALLVDPTVLKGLRARLARGALRI